MVITRPMGQVVSCLHRLEPGPLHTDRHELNSPWPELGPKGSSRLSAGPRGTRKKNLDDPEMQTIPKD